MMEDASWSVLQDIYMERIAEIEAARDALWKKCENYQAEIVRLQSLVLALEEQLSVSTPY